MGVHARVAVVVAVVVAVFRVVSQRYFLLEAQLVPARSAAIRAVSRGNCGFVCIRKTRLPARIVGHCAARAVLPGRWTILQGG